jgi:hypothetical protein
MWLGILGGAVLLVSLGLGLFVLGCGFLCHLRASRAATHSRLRKFGAFKANSPTPNTTPISGGGGGSSASDQAARKGRAPKLAPRSPQGLAIIFHHTMAGSQQSGSKRDAVGQCMPRACVPASPVPSACFIELAFPYTPKSPPLPAGTQSISYPGLTGPTATTRASVRTPASETRTIRSPKLQSLLISTV